MEYLVLIAIVLIGVFLAIKKYYFIAISLFINALFLPLTMFLLIMGTGGPDVSAFDTIVAFLIVHSLPLLLLIISIVMTTVANMKIRKAEKQQGNIS